MLSTYTYPTFSSPRAPELDQPAITRRPVVVVGAGPVGLSAAIELAQQGQPVLLLDDDDTVSIGSRGLCYAQRTLQILDRQGCGQAVVDKGCVNEDAIGIQGHSWGGYQTAFLITQTNAFKAAVAGAPLTNLISMYSSVYWNTGSANQAIFQSSQGRFKGNFIENKDAYDLAYLLRNHPAGSSVIAKVPGMLFPGLSNPTQR